MSATTSGLMALLVWCTGSLVLACLSAVPAMEMMTISFFGGFLVLTIYQIICKKPMREYWTQSWKTYLFWLLGPGLYTTILFIAYKLAPAYEVNTLNYLWPILLAVFAAILHRAHLTFIRIGGILAGFVGLVFVMLPTAHEEFFETFRLGYVLAIVGAFLWAGYSSYRSKMSYPIGFLAPAFFVLSMICLTLHFVFEKTVLPHLWEIALLLILSLSRVSYAFWDYAMKKGDIILLTSLSYFLPLITTFSLIAFGFVPQKPFIAYGSILIILGCLLVNGDKLQDFFSKRFLRTP